MDYITLQLVTEFEIGKKILISKKKVDSSIRKKIRLTLKSCESIEAYTVFYRKRHRISIGSDLLLILFVANMNEAKTIENLFYDFHTSIDLSVIPVTQPNLKMFVSGLHNLGIEIFDNV